MSDAKFVYREVSGRELEKATMDGWEFVTSSTTVGPFGPLGSYLVRRPFELPDMMKLTAELDAAKEALERSKEAKGHLEARLARWLDAVKRNAVEARRSGRDKPTRADLVSMASSLAGDLQRDLG